MISWARNQLLAYNNLTVLVTGASGFIGHRLVQILKLLDANVTQIQKTQTSLEPNIQRLDLSDYSKCSQLFRERSFDIIFHLAGWVSRKSEIRYVQKANQSNLITTLNVLENAAKYSPTSKIVIPGSILENSQVQTPYSVSKAATSLYVDLFQKLYHYNISRLGICLTYGPNQNPNGLIPYTINAFINNDPVIKLNINRLLDIIYLDDVVNALLLTGISPSHPTPLYIGSNQPISAKQITDTIAQLMNKDPELVTFNLNEKSNYEYSTEFSNPEEYIDWKPQWDIQQGLMKTIEWHLAKRDLS